MKKLIALIVILSLCLASAALAECPRLTPEEYLVLANVAYNYFSVFA